MSNLLIDIGNSDVKIGTAISGSASIRLLTRFSYSKDNFVKDFSNNFPKTKVTKKFDRIGISILKDGDTRFLRKLFKSKFNRTPQFIVRNSKLPFKIDYTSGLGNDRICNAAAAVMLFKHKDILVIDFGTATTYTMIANKILIGGMIAPGVKTSIDSLISKTSLPGISLKFPPKLINNNTIDNIRAGVLFQTLLSADSIVSNLKLIYKNLFVIATGGFSKLISQKSDFINVVDKNLVLKGINQIISS